MKIKNENIGNMKTERNRLLGYVPVQTLNITKEEIILPKGYHLGDVASLCIDKCVAQITQSQTRKFKKKQMK